METKLIDYPKLLNEKYQTLQAVVNPYVEELPNITPVMKDIQNVYDMKVNNTKPQIMVYGIYNAGKSSIINELIRDDKAVVRDKPTTDRVDYYDWNGYKIADTPGVGAPIEHEQVTNEHLKIADVVLFVMSTTGSNEKKENYVRMKDIVDAGKKIIIILNDKNGDLGKRDEIIQAIKIKVSENMKTVGIQDVDSKYYIVVVNAARAKKGRLENKQGLLKRSGIDELERVILSELKKTDKFTIWINAINEIETNLNKLSEIFNASNSNETVKQFEHILDTLKTQKIEMNKDIKGHIQIKSNRLHEELFSAIWDNKDDEAKVQEAIQSKIQWLSNDAQKYTEQKFHELEDILNSDIQDLQDYLNSVEVKGDFNVEVKDIHIEGKSFSDEDFNIGNMLGNAEATLSIAKIALPTAVNAAKSILPAVLVRPAVALIPYIGPAIAVVSALKSFFGNNEEHERMQAEAKARTEFEKRKAEAEQQAKQDLNQKCGYLVEDIVDNLSYEISNVIRNTIGDIEKNFRVQAKDSKSELNKKLQVAETIRNLENEFNTIKLDLSNGQN